MAESVRVGHGACNGSFGEILQGMLPSGHKFLVNLPITLESRATLTLTGPAYDREKEERFADAYRRWPKAHKAILLLMGRRGFYGHDFALTFPQELPRSKGLSSSTADMVAALRAYGRATSNVSFVDIDETLQCIEPNDGVHYPGTAIYCHEEAALLNRYDYVPPWRILGIDEGGTVDTVEFNRRPRVWPESQCAQWETLLKRAQALLADGDSTGLARLATQSTEIWQEAHPKGHYRAVMEFAEQTGALGVVNTHSGTYLGVIYPADHEMGGELELARRVMPECETRVFETKA